MIDGTPFIASFQSWKLHDGRIRLLYYKAFTEWYKVVMKWILVVMNSSSHKRMTAGTMRLQAWTQGSLCQRCSEWRTIFLEWSHRVSDDLRTNESSNKLKNFWKCVSCVTRVIQHPSPSICSITFTTGHRNDKEYEQRKLFSSDCNCKRWFTCVLLAEIEP